ETRLRGRDPGRDCRCGGDLATKLLSLFPVQGRSRLRLARSLDRRNGRGRGTAPEERGPTANGDERHRVLHEADATGGCVRPRQAGGRDAGLAKPQPDEIRAAGARVGRGDRCAQGLEGGRPQGTPGGDDSGGDAARRLTALVRKRRQGGYGELRAAGGE